jgi:competence protein ComEC
LRFYQKTWFTILTLLFLPPLGIFLLWYNKMFKKPLRIGLSAVFALFFLVFLIGSSEANDGSKTAATSNGSAQQSIVRTDSTAAASENTSNNSSESSNTAAPAGGTTNGNTSVTGQLKIHFINVGQADSILIQSSEGKFVLVDGGNNEDGPSVVNYLKSQGVKELAAVVATHPHEDHIGGLDTVINSFRVSSVYMPNATSTTKTFEDFINAVKNSGAKRVQTKAGVNLDVPSLNGTFLAPNGTSYEDLNDYSAVLRITFGGTSFLLTGDAESVSESEMLKNGQTLRSTLLKVGHHGSSSSTSRAFLNAVAPKYAVISVGAGNTYGHPAQDTLNRLASAGVQVFRTDQVGTVIATSDGQNISFNKSTQMPAAPTTNTAPPTSSAQPAPAPVPVTPSPSGAVKITSIDLSAEVVTIVNSTNGSVDLSGWKLVSETGNQTFNFPSGTKIAAGVSLKIASGPNAKPGTGILVWTTANMWNNSGDPGALYNAQGQLISRY